MASAAHVTRTETIQPRRSHGGGFLSPAFIDELRNRTTLSALVGRSVKLQKAGREFKACCPFHNEKSPSFYVNDEKAFYHCFGCGAHGDAIRFLTEAKGLPFMDAVKELAQSAGMELPAPDPAARARAERATGLVSVSEAAASWFRKQLDSIEGATARNYLQKRGIGQHAREAFGLGYAPDGRNRLVPALPETKESELVEAGLLIKPDGNGKAYDRFRGRLMIPIRDARGRTIAFGGRILDSGEPKYLNSPDTPLFDKGRTLFNLDRAGPLARKHGRVIVVEGYLDVIALDQAGVGEAVAPLGTALTEAQMARLWNLVDAPILCFDGDVAGRKAGIRAAHRALAVLQPGKTLRFALLPTGKDPDDLVREGGAEAFEEAIANPIPLDVLLYEAARDSADMNRPEARAGLRQTLNDLATSCGDRLMAEEYRRSFNALFFEDFGWKKAERRVIGSAILRSGAGKRRDVRDGFIEAALYRLSREPRLIADVLSQLSTISTPDEKLMKWKDVLVDAAFRNPGLDSDVVASILEAALLPEVLQFNLQKQLNFPFFDQNLDEARRNEQLFGLIETLHDEREFKEHMQMLDAEAKGAVADSDKDGYGRVESERADVRKQQAKLLEKAFALGERERD